MSWTFTKNEFICAISHNYWVLSQFSSVRVSYCTCCILKNMQLAEPKAGFRVTLGGANNPNFHRYYLFSSNTADTHFPLSLSTLTLLKPPLCRQGLDSFWQAYVRAGWEINGHGSTSDRCGLRHSGDVRLKALVPCSFHLLPRLLCSSNATFSLLFVICWTLQELFLYPRFPNFSQWSISDM